MWCWRTTAVTLNDIDLGIVPRPSIFKPPSPTADRCNPTPPVPIPVRYRPLIPDSPITQAVSLQLAGSPVTPASCICLRTVSSR